MPLDLRRGEDIDKLAPAIAERFGRLDILVGNAGLLGTMTPAHQIRPDEWDEVIAVNLTANWRLIRALDPLLRASDAGRAMFVTSGVAGGRAYWGAYAVSKTALGMRAEAYPGEDPMTLPAPEAVTDVFVELASPACTRHGEVVGANR